MYCQSRLLQIRYIITMTTFIFFPLPTLTCSYFGNSRECDTLTKLSFSWKTARLHISNWVHKQILQRKAFSEAFSVLKTVFNAIDINYSCRGICFMVTQWTTFRKKWQSLFRQVRKQTTPWLADSTESWHKAKFRLCYSRWKVFHCSMGRDR